MKEDTKTAIACATYLLILLIYINIMFYSIYQLPFGMLDVDGYLYHSGDQDPRLQYINQGKRIQITYEYTVFYTLLKTLGNPRITFLWLPPLILSILILQIYWIYDAKGKNALTETIMFATMTYAIPFFYTAALYRQLLGMTLLLTGYNLTIRHKKIPGYSLIALGFMTHIHLTPIAAIYILADRINKHKWLQSTLLVILGTTIAIKTNIILAIGPFLPTPQPTLYTQLFTLTNPILLLYALKKPKYDFKHILLILLLLTMPFTDQSRGLIFLHITLTTIAYQKYTQEKTPKYYHIILIILSYLWLTNLLNFLLHSMIQDSIERNLNLQPIIDYLYTHT